MSIQQTGVLTFKFKGFKEVCGFFHQALTFKYTAAPPVDVWHYCSDISFRAGEKIQEEMNRVGEMEGVDQLIVTPPPK